MLVWCPLCCFFFKQKTAYEMRISDWSSDVCSSDLVGAFGGRADIMEHIAPIGPVYQAGTLSGNPVAVAAGRVTLRLLSEPGFYERLSARTAKLVDGLIERANAARSEEHTSELQSLMRISYAVFCLKKKKQR